jgi:hypothetical protein
MCVCRGALLAEDVRFSEVICAERRCGTAGR